MVLFDCFMYTVILKWCSSLIKTAGTLSHRAFLSCASPCSFVFSLGNLIQVVGIAFGSSEMVEKRLQWLSFVICAVVAAVVLPSSMLACVHAFICQIAQIWNTGHEKLSRQGDLYQSIDAHWQMLAEKCKVCDLKSCTPFYQHAQLETHIWTHYAVPLSHTTVIQSTGSVSSMI